MAPAGPASNTSSQAPATVYLKLAIEQPRGPIEHEWNPVMRAMTRASRLARNLPAWIRSPAWVPDGHFYSPIPSTRDRDRAEERASRGRADGVDLRADEQLKLATHLGPLWEETARDLLKGDWRYSANNELFSMPDAAIYASMLRHLRPKRVIEVGSGYSSVLALDVSERWLGPVELTCIEPYPQTLLALLRPTDGDRLNVIRSDVQELDPAIFDSLRENDILFIDSTHVVRPGGDVVFLVLDILPRLHPGVYVHVHDIFWPFEYSPEWHREGRVWAEAYLVHAFLVNNSSWRISFFADWFWTRYPELVKKYLPTTQGHRAGSLWLRRVS